MEGSKKATHLRRGLAVLLRDLADNGRVEEGLLGQSTGVSDLEERLGAEGGVGHDLDLEQLAEIRHLGLGEVS